MGCGSSMWPSSRHTQHHLPRIKQPSQCRRRGRCLGASIATHAECKHEVKIQHLEFRSLSASSHYRRYTYLAFPHLFQVVSHVASNKTSSPLMATAPGAAATVLNVPRRHGSASSLRPGDNDLVPASRSRRNSDSSMHAVRLDFSPSTPPKMVPTLTNTLSAHPHPPHNPTPHRANHPLRLLSPQGLRARHHGAHEAVAFLQEVARRDS